MLKPRTTHLPCNIIAEATAPVFLNTLLMQTTANRKLLQDIKEGVAKVIQEANEHASILDLKITACDTVIDDIEKMMLQHDSFPPPPPASPEANTAEPAGGTPEEMRMFFILT